MERKAEFLVGREGNKTEDQTVVHEILGCVKKSLSQGGHLPERLVSRLIISANEILPGAVQRSPSICLIAERNPGKPQLGDHLMKVVRPIIAPKEVPNI